MSRWPAMTVGERFWRKVQMTDGCWLWSAGRRSDGRYGAFYLEGRDLGAHVVAWLLTHGPIPVGLKVCHHCDVPLCVKPDHLYLATQRQNLQDASARDRFPRALRSRNQRDRMASDPRARATALANLDRAHARRFATKALAALAQGKRGIDGSAVFALSDFEDLVRATSRAVQFAARVVRT